MNVTDYKALYGIIRRDNESKTILEIPTFFFKHDFLGIIHVTKFGRYRRKHCKLKLPRQCLKTTQFKEGLTEEVKSAVVGLEKI